MCSGHTSNFNIRDIVVLKPGLEVSSLLLEVSDRECVVAIHLILTFETLLC